MPTLGVNRDNLFKALGKVYTEDEFSELCFEFGLELDEVTSEKHMIDKELGGKTDKSAGASEDIIYRIDVPANRYDLLCIEGLVRGLMIFMGKIEVPQYRAVKPAKLQQLIVLPSTQKVRPFVVGAVLRNITFTKEVYNSFIDLQDKLHQNVCRKRTLVSIGTHDLDTISGPFYYDAKPPSASKFVALNQTKAYSTGELLDLYSGDSHLKAYVPIVKDEPLHPIIYDSNGTVLSFPPIINSEHSKIKLSTKNVLVEITATDLFKAQLVLDTLVCMFSEYCADKFAVESVEVVNADSTSVVYPRLQTREKKVQVDKINGVLGTSLSAAQMVKLLTKMSLISSVSAKDSNELSVTIPPTRQDVLHARDIAEDVGIAHGYNNIERTFPQVVTIGKQLLLNKVSDQLRFEISRAGFTEVLTFSLCSRDDISLRLRKQDGLRDAVHVGNPKTLDFQVARTTLIPGLLKTLNANKKMPLPLKIFEISDIVLKNSERDVGAINNRRICALNYSKTPGFEIIHGLLDRIMQVLEVKYVGDAAEKSKGYFVEAHQDDSYLTGRCARIVANKKPVGIMGVLHPDVMTNFDLIMPCSILELDLEALNKL